jgi:uncharacterized membrane protein HdeD (DUF308 family)
VSGRGFVSATQDDATPGDPRSDSAAPGRAAPHTAAPTPAYWPVPLARAVPAGLLGLYITFSADHSAQLGLVLFGAFALASGAILLLLRDRFADRVVRGNVLVQGGLAALLGALALVFNGGGLGLLLLLIPAFRAITGFLELYSGLRARRHPGFIISSHRLLEFLRHDLLSNDDIPLAE